LSLKAPRNWVQKNGPKRRWVSRANWLLGLHLDWLRQRLAALEADKARFVRHISHELKTPLAALVEGVALLEDEVAGPLAPNQREVASILRQNTASLQTQIEDLLRYNAASFEAQRLQREHADIRPIVERVVESQRLQWQSRGLTVTVEGDAPPVPVDADKLSVAISNLLSNAARFSPEHGAVRFVIALQRRLRAMAWTVLRVRSISVPRSWSQLSMLPAPLPAAAISWVRPEWASSRVSTARSRARRS
jgi:signal transduction histidine kinase